MTEVDIIRQIEKWGLAVDKRDFESIQGFGAKVYIKLINEGVLTDDLIVTSKTRQVDNDILSGIVLDVLEVREEYNEAVKNPIEDFSDFELGEKVLKRLNK